MVDATTEVIDALRYLGGEPEMRRIEGGLSLAAVVRGGRVEVALTVSRDGRPTTTIEASGEEGAVRETLEAIELRILRPSEGISTRGGDIVGEEGT